LRKASPSGNRAYFGRRSSAFRVARLLIVPLSISAACLVAQNPPSTAPTVTEGTKLYAQRCAGCHGADARGTDNAPGLAGNPALRDRAAQELRDLIRKGVPASGMPAFDLLPRELDALVALVRSMNGPPAQSTTGGDPTAGESFFFGKGQCASCHMISGSGAAIGPDLSNVGREMTVDEIRAKLLNPNLHITPGYELAAVQLRDGNTIRGFVRSRSNFDLRLQDLTGQFHLIQEGEISAITEEKQSIMPPVEASREELRDLITYLGKRTRLAAEFPKSSSSNAPGIDFARISNPKPGEWLTYNGNLSGNRYSELAQINTANVHQLALKWIFSVPLWKNLLPNTEYFVENMRYFGLETTPIVADGVMYVTGPNSAFALDPLTGREIWEYSRPRTRDLVGDAALGTNRGVAVLADKIFMVTDNAHLIALNRTTGQVMWEVVMPDEPQHFGSTLAPLVVKDLVVAGVSGADWGIRGFVAAYKASTGERAWRFWTIPAKGEPGSETWGRQEPAFGGGSTWLTGSYDPETDVLYWSTGNPFPDSDDRNRPGDNLFTNCILALNPDTGKLKWYYQVTPHDVFDWDANAPLVLVDTKYQGSDRKLLLHANKNGFFYVLDRTDGHVLLARNFVRTTWASGIAPDGRPQRVPEDGLLCPDVGTNWNATAFSPDTRLYYVVALEKCEAKLTSAGAKRRKAEQEPGKKYLRALDIETGRVVWEAPQIGPVEGKRNGGLLATAGGVLFYGDPSGDVEALDERSGKVLWHFPTSGINKASPMTYTVNDKQFVALAVGPNVLCFGLP
jgi:PQQ-dependent dehydrogenase (methanol/ethanol family)